MIRFQSYRFEPVAAAAPLVQRVSVAPGYYCIVYAATWSCGAGSATKRRCKLIWDEGAAVDGGDSFQIDSVAQYLTNTRVAVAMLDAEGTPFDAENSAQFAGGDCLVITDVAETIAVMRLPRYILNRDFSVSLTISNLQAGDQVSAGRLVVAHGSLDELLRF